MDKQNAVVAAILESVELEGTKLREWRGTKALTEILLPSEYEKILRRLTDLGFIVAIPTPILLAEARQDGLPPYDIVTDTEALQTVSSDHQQSLPEGVTIINTTLLIDGQRVELGRGAHNYTIQYWIAILTLKKPGRPVEELRILEKYGDEGARGRAVADATRLLNKKVKTVTGINDMFIYSSGYVSYSPLC